MAKWSLLREALDGVESSVTYSWAELDALVGGMPPSATKWPAWWSDSASHSHVKAWESAGFTIANLVRGVRVTFVRRSEAALVAEPKTGDLPAIKASANAGALGDVVQQPHGLQPLRDVDVILLSCVKQKLSTPAPAEDLYISSTFRKERSYAEDSGRPWFILSAEHGLVTPGEWISPYDRYLPDTPQAYKEAWGAWVVARLELIVGELRGRTVEVRASASYVKPLRVPLEARGANLIDSFEGKNRGQRMAAYGPRGSDCAGDRVAIHGESR